MSLSIIKKTPSSCALRAFRYPTTSFYSSLLFWPNKTIIIQLLVSSSSFSSGAAVSKPPPPRRDSFSASPSSRASQTKDSVSFSSSTSNKPSRKKDDDCEGQQSEKQSGKEQKEREKSPPAIPRAHLTPEKRGHWMLMDSSGKESVSIPVLSTVSKLDENHGAGPSSAANNNNTGNKPVSMWPGMYHSPVTAALWAARSTILERVMNATTDGHAQRELLIRTPAQSRTSILYTFSNDEILQEQYRNPWKGVRIGKLLEDLDALAGTIAVKHCADDDLTTRPLMLVTASVDKISLFKPLNLTEDLTIAGAVAWVGRSSMEIRMEVIQPPVAEEESKEDSLALVANFTFVARDIISKKAAQINRLRPETDEEKRLFQSGEARDAQRKQGRTGGTERSKAAKAVQDDLKLQALLTEGRVLREMPTLADRNTILMKDTKLENAIICQPQQRNMHGRIFGGFLMRRAYELAYSTCYVFCGTKPVFLEVDHVDFLRPVDVGDLLRFKSCVLHTENEHPDQQLMHIEVTAHVTQPELRTSEVSNTFYFTFTLDEDVVKAGAPPIFRVVPGTEEEARRVMARHEVEIVAKYPLLEKQLSQRSLK